VSYLKATITANGTAAPFDVRPASGGGIFTLPPAQTFAVQIPQQYLGPVTARVVAIDAQGASIGEDEGSTTLAEGETKTIGLLLTPGGGDGGMGDVVITPPSAAVPIMGMVAFSANLPVDWSVQEGAAGGAIDAMGNYTAPSVKGVYHVVARSKADSSKSATATVSVASGVLELLAGQPGGPGNVDGPRLSARFRSPHGVALDGAGNIYVADQANHCIRKIAAAGTVTTLAGTPGTPGTADGIGAAARFGGPQGIASDGASLLFVADTGNHTVRQVNVMTGAVVTVAGRPGVPGNLDGAASVAQFDFPRALAFEAGDVFVADTNNHTIRKVGLQSGVVSSLAGSVGSSGSSDGTAGVARFNLPNGIAGDGTGSLYVSDAGNATVRRIIVASQLVSTLAGTAGMKGTTDGTGAAARFFELWGLAYDGGNLYISDFGSKTIRRLVVSTGVVTTVAGTVGVAGSRDGVGSAALFTEPAGVARDGAGNIYIAENGLHTIRRMVTATNTVATYAGAASSPGTIDGVGSAAQFTKPKSVAIEGGFAYVADESFKIRKVEIATGTVSTASWDALRGCAHDGRRGEHHRFLLASPPGDSLSTPWLLAGSFSLRSCAARHLASRSLTSRRKSATSTSG
jgi:hypothetical protein